MSSLLIGLIPGVVALGAVLLIVRGIYLAASDPSEALDLDEVALLKKAERDRHAGPLESLAMRFLPVVRGALPTRAVSWIQKQVNAAGRPDGMTVDTVLADMLKWAVIVVPLAVFVLVQGMAFIALLALFIPPVIPLGKLTGDVKRRKEQIDQDLPSFMDVLAVTVTAGIGFRRALRTVSERYGGPLADEIQLTLQHVDNGASMRQAFTALRDRTGSAAVDEFVSAYVQSEELGAPLVDTLPHRRRHAPLVGPGSAPAGLENRAACFSRDDDGHGARHTRVTHWRPTYWDGHAPPDLGDVQVSAPSRPVLGWSQLVQLTRAALALRLLAVFVGLLSPADRLMTPVQIIVIVAMSTVELRFTEFLALLEAHPMLALVDLAIVVGFVAVAGATSALQLTVLTTAFLVGLWVDRLGGAIAMLMLVALWVLALVMRKASDDEVLSHKILRASLIATTAAEERAKLATELHDKLAKTIQSVALMTSVIPAAVETDPARAITAARQAHQMSARAVTELRGVMSGLRSNGTDLVFGEAVIGLVSTWQSAEGRHVQLTVDEDMVLKRPDVQFEVLAALSESLDNIAQHAGHCDVDVIVSKEGSILTVVVRDTGKGFSESELRACQRVGHQGVLDVQRRLVRIGGLADVSSEVGRGTTVTMVVHDEPLEERE